jgi:fibronectin type 3 domain-containing protein
MKRVLLYRSIIALSFAYCALLLVSCAMREGESLQRTNPYDASGDNFLYDKVPVFKTLPADSLLWADYNFSTNTGTLKFTFSATDSNLPYDSLTSTLLAGSAADSLDTVYHGRDSVFELAGLSQSRQVFYKIIIADKYDSTIDTTGSVFTPAGIPPLPPTNVTISIYSNTDYCYLSWYASANTPNYSIYRSDSETGGFQRIDLLSGSTTSHSDFPSDYILHRYRIGSRNSYGEAMAKDTLFGWVPLTSLPILYLTVSTGTYRNFIEVKWDVSSGNSSSISNCKVFRAKSSSGNYSLIAVAPYNQQVQYQIYRDSVRSDSTYYYKVAAFDAQGRGGYFTSYDNGYLKQLSSPYSISASDGTFRNYIQVSWSSVSGVKGYYVYRADSYNGNYVKIDSTTGLTYRDSTVDSTIDYYYKVAVYDSSGKVSNLSSSYDYGYIARLASPSSVSASDGTYSDNIQVSWSSVYGAKGYFIYRATSSSSLYSKIDSTNLTLYRDSSIDSSINYYYKIMAYDSTGRKSNLSTSYDYGYVARLSSPSSVNASDGASPLYIQVTWSSLSGAQGYNIYRSTSSSGAFEKIGSAANVFYYDTASHGGISGTYYYYKVAAYNSKGYEGYQSGYNSGYLASISSVSGLTATLGTYPDSIKLTWQAVNGISTYRVYRANSSASSSAIILDTVTTTSYCDTAVSPESGYIYHVTAFAFSNEGSAGSTVSGRTMYAPPNFIALSGKTVVTLTWSAPIAVTAFQIYRASHPDSSFVKIADLASNTIAYWDTVVNYASYWYRITASNTNGASPAAFSGPAGRLPSLVANLISIDTINGATLQWSTAFGATGYIVFRSTQPNSSANFGPIDTITDTSYQIADTSSNRYYYKVTAYNGNGNGDAATPIKAGKLMPPGIPDSLAAIGTQKYVRLTWRQGTNGSAPAQYYLYRSTTIAGTYDKIDSVTALSYQDTFTGITGYFYRISAVNSLGESSMTAAIAGNRIAPPVPTGLSASNALYGSHIDLYWYPALNATGYVLYRANTSGIYIVIDSLLDTTYADSSASTTDISYYRLASYNDVGVSVQGNTAAGSKVLPPRNIAVASNQSHIAISWDSSSGALGYFLYRATAAAGPFTRIDSVETRIYYDTVPGPTMYYYKVSAFRLDESALSNASNGAQRLLPTVPTLISATQGSMTDTIRLVWRRSSGADGYRVYRASDSAFAYPVLRLSTVDTVCYDTAGSDSQFFYKVKAYNTAGESVLGNKMSGFRKPSTPPDAPASLAATDALGAYIELTWSIPATGTPVNGYKIFRSTTQTGTYDLIDSTITTSFKDYVPLSFPTYYWYKVKAFNFAGDGVFSAAESGTRK